MTTHLDLCSGIGGFALAARWHGIQTIGFCEIDPWCRRVLSKNFPGVPQHDDLTTLSGGTVRGWAEGVKVLANSEGGGLGGESQSDKDAWLGPPGIGGGFAGEGGERRLALLTAGYPCQPFSLAGKRLGAEDDRHLWPYIAALVDDLRPTWCLFENVAGHITLGLDRVLSDLEEIGYACRAVVVPACAVGAPHRRDRVWIMAHANRGRELQPQGIVTHERGWLGNGSEPNGRETLAYATSGGIRRGEAPRQPGFTALGGETLADAARERDERGGGARNGRTESANGGTPPHANGTGRREQRGAVADEPQYATAERGGGRKIIARLGPAHDGVPGWVDERLARPWDGGWEDGVPRVTDGCPDRTHKLKALGNAIVPQVAYVLMGAMFADDRACQPERRAS